MLIIHASYSKSNFYLWGEISFTAEDIIPVTGTDTETPQIHPWGAEEHLINEALKLAGIRRARKGSQKKTVTAYLSLPSRGRIPIPSSPLLGEISPLEGTVSLGRYSVKAIPLSYDELAAIYEFLNNEEEKLSVPGMIFADDVKFLTKSLEYAAIMACRGTYYPYMECEEGSYFSRWKPLHLMKYQEETSVYEKSLPNVMRTFSLSPEDFFADRRELAFDILESLLDNMVRSVQSSSGAKGRKVDGANTHDLWLRSLIWPQAPLDSWADEMESLHAQIISWSESLKTVTGQPWRLFMRLEEPDKEDGEDKSWILSWHLQSVSDPSLIIPAAKVWAPEEAERSWFCKIGSNPRRYLLEILGHLASIVPAIAGSLESPYPTECALNIEELFDFLQNHVPALIDQGIQIHFPSSWGSLSDRPRLAVKGTLHDSEAFSVGSRLSLGDLMEVDWSVSLGEDVLTEEELVLLTELKAPLANIRGRWVLLYKDEIEKIIEGMKTLPKKINRREALLASFSEGRGDIPISNITGSKWLDSIRNILTGREEMEEIPQPEGFNGTLRPYQSKGLSWMSWLTKFGLGGCLADDMGLGKTVQTLAMIQTMRIKGERRPVLLVCPTSVIENWRRETEKFLPGTNVLIHHGMKRLKGSKLLTAAKESALVISSYSLIHRDNAQLCEIPWCGVILDEAQNIKNPDTRQSRAARSIPADWHLALTGTPVENHVGDMWSIMEFILPGLLPNKTRFAREFLRPIQAGEAGAMQKIRRMTAPFILRRLKTDKSIISDLPEKIESHVFCSLGKEQASLYSAVIASLDEKIGDSEGIQRKGVVLAAVTALKQICNHPALYLKDESEIRDRSGKLVRLTEIAEEMLAAGDRALIFTQYASMGEILKKFLQETFGREVLFLHGGIPREKRDEMVQKFQGSDNPPPFFVLSLKAGGTGLNLTGANHVIMFDRWWNPAVEQQAVDRAYRIGQKNRVQVHYFCCRGTLEEKIEALIASKRAIADSVVGTGENWLTELSDEELRKLFTLSADAVEDIK